MIRFLASGLLVLTLPVVAAGQAARQVSPTAAADVTAGAAAPAGFVEVIDARLLSDGGFVVADRGEGRLHFFDRDGRALRSAGGAGAGPGEFRGLTWIQVLRGDSVVAYDWQQRRFSLFDARGRHVRDWKYQPPQGVNNAAPRGMMPNGGVLLTIRRTATFPFEGREGEVRPDSVELLALAPDGSLAWRGRLMQAGEVFGFAYRRGTERYLAGVELPFAPTLAWGITPQGLVATEGRHPRLHIFSPTGRSTDMPVTLPAPVPITAAMRSALAGRFGACDRGAGDDVEPELGNAVASLRSPTILPAIGRLLVDPRGGIWVSPGSASGYPAVCGMPLPDSRRWSLLNASGGLAASIDLPAPMRVTDIGLDRMIGLEVDDDDVVHVVVHTLTPR